eukprot:170955-Rhodomonas_salina.3
MQVMRKRMTKELATGMMDLARALMILRSALSRPNSRITRNTRISRRIEIPAPPPHARVTRRDQAAGARNAKHRERAWCVWFRKARIGLQLHACLASPAVGLGPGIAETPTASNDTKTTACPHHRPPRQTLSRHRDLMARR